MHYLLKIRINYKKTEPSGPEFVDVVPRRRVGLRIGPYHGPVIPFN